MAELHEWLNAQLAKISRNHDVAKAINYMLRRWRCGSAWKKDPGSGVIGVEKGPLIPVV